ncbi:MAG: hypothetical protein RLZZ453_874 [Chlamydiota bacterium]|jgi:hypothetical protein
MTDCKVVGLTREFNQAVKHSSTLPRSGWRTLAEGLIGLSNECHDTKNTYRIISSAFAALTAGVFGISKDVKFSSMGAPLHLDLGLLSGSVTVLTFLVSEYYRGKAFDYESDAMQANLLATSTPASRGCSGLAWVWNVVFGTSGGVLDSGSKSVGGKQVSTYPCWNFSIC